MKASFCCIALLLFVHLAVGGIMRPSDKLTVMANEGFLVYLEVLKNFGEISNCWFRYDGSEKVLLDLNSTVEIVTSRGEVVLPFSSTVCGIRVSKLSSVSAGLWTLEAENVYEDFEMDNVYLTVLAAQPTNLETRVWREFGYGTISCTKHDIYTKHCKIIENDTGDEWPQCQLLTIMRPNRTFECLMSNLGRITETHELITVDIIGSVPNANATTEETDEHFVLSCQLSQKPEFCYVESPNSSQELYINDGLYNQRYSAYDTMISKSLCSLELQKPLQPLERGLWRIYGYRTNDISGCLYYVGATRQDIIAEELKRLSLRRHVIKANAPEESSTLPGKIDEISCILPFVVDECYLRDPNNTVHFPDKFEFQRSAPFGKCTFKNLPLIAGNWICGVRSANYEKEVLQDIEVLVTSKNGEVLTPSLKAQQNGNVQLMCRSAYEEPITRCVFVDPQNNVHLVSSLRSQKTSGHIHYSGRGLEYGDCGIMINQISLSDFGRWSCQLGFPIKKDSIFTMILNESAIGTATSIGLGIGLTIIIALITGVLIGTVFYRRHNRRVEHSLTSAHRLDEFQMSVPNVSASNNELTSNL